MLGLINTYSLHDGLDVGLVVGLDVGLVMELWLHLWFILDNYDALVMDFVMDL
jgi:hypothetical protein